MCIYIDIIEETEFLTVILVASYTCNSVYTHEYIVT